MEDIHFSFKKLFVTSLWWVLLKIKHIWNLSISAAGDVHLIHLTLLVYSTSHHQSLPASSFAGWSSKTSSTVGRASSLSPSHSRASWMDDLTSNPVSAPTGQPAQFWAFPPLSVFVCVHETTCSPRTPSSDHLWSCYCVWTIMWSLKRVFPVHMCQAVPMLEPSLYSILSMFSCCTNISFTNFNC